MHWRNPWQPQSYAVRLGHQDHGDIPHCGTELRYDR